MLQCVFRGKHLDYLLGSGSEKQLSQVDSHTFWRQDIKVIVFKSANLAKSARFGGEKGIESSAR